MVFDGWILRLADGYTGRANSVQTFYPGILPLQKKIGHCESVYRAQGLPVRFKLTSASQPQDLDAQLANRGYAVHSPVSVQTAELGDIGEAPDVRVEDRAGPEWIAAYCRMSGVPGAHRETFAWMVRNIVPATGFASRSVGGQIVSVGLGVHERGWLGLFDVATDEKSRRQGHASAIVRSLMAWGRRHGATRCYLQATMGNDPAHALYESFGFREAYRYWYRVDGS